MRRRWSSLFLVLLLGALPSSGGAQSDCSEDLEKAELSYKSGRYAEAMESAERCLQARPRPSRDAHKDARSWRVLAHSKFCDSALAEGNSDYRSGLFKAALASAERCLQLRPRPSREDREEANELLARAYVALDDLEAARRAILQLIRYNPEFSSTSADSNVFVYLVKESKRELAQRVTSVSRVEEDMREAPATVVVITAEEIERRGYLDLEQVFHDLPGFDVTRGNGDVYSNLYQRGFRSNTTDRLLFLVDGVEQNDLHSNVAYISRQYALSNIDRIEVVYAPASTIYGANAYTGVVSVITKDPLAILEETPVEASSVGEIRDTRDNATENRFAATGHLSRGDFNTESLDFTLAGSLKDRRTNWSLSGRSFTSDGVDLSSFDNWDFDPTAPAEDEYQVLLRQFRGLVTTAEQRERARLLDQALLDQLKSRSFVATDQTDDWSLSGKLNVSGLSVGVQLWRREEGNLPWYTDLLRVGRGDGSVLTPKQSVLHLSYRRPIGTDLSLSLFARYKEHEFDGDSSVARFGLYANGFYDNSDAGNGERPFFERLDIDQVSTQLRAGATAVWEPSTAFNLVVGAEARESTVQADYRSRQVELIPVEVCPLDDPGDCTPFDPLRFEDPFPENPERREVRTTDLGVLAQASWSGERLKLVVGGRLDDNRARRAGTPPVDGLALLYPAGRVGDSVDATREMIYSEAVTACLLTNPNDPNSQSITLPPPGPDFDALKSCVDDFFTPRGFGNVFNSRLALTYTWKEFVLKAIYSEAFKEATNFQKFTREPFTRELPNPLLEPEEVGNFELVANWQPGDRTTFEVALYQATYKKSPVLRRFFIGGVPSATGIFENVGSLRIRGLQATASSRLGPVDVFGNFTYTEPFDTAPTNEFGEPLEGVDRLRVGDIARHRLNLGASTRLRDRLELSLRANLVGDRPRGSGTTVDPTTVDPITLTRTSLLSDIDSYVAVHGAVSYGGADFLSGAKLQLVVNNLFDEHYYHSGVQLAGFQTAAALPQAGRSVFLRLLYRYGR